MRANGFSLLAVLVVASLVLSECGAAVTPVPASSRPQSQSTSQPIATVTLNNPQIKGEVPIGWYFIPVGLLAGAATKSNWIPMVEGGAIVAYFAPALPVGIAVLTAVSMVFNGSAVLQQSAEGPIVIRTKSEEITIDRVTGQVTRVVKTQVKVEEKVSQATPSQGKKVAVVVTDDMPQDVVQTAAAVQVIFTAIGGYNARVIQCLDLQCTVAGALRGGPDGSQAIAVFSDGGLLGDGWKLPVGAPYPTKPCLSNPCNPFTAGPWVVAYLRQLGYRGKVFFVTAESGKFIHEFEGHENATVFTKDWFWSVPKNSVGAVKTAFMLP